MTQPVTESGLAKSYSARAAEPVVDAKWRDAGAFHAQAGQAREPYCIFIPPPNVTAALHLGHALNNSLQDVLIRTARMRGFNTLWMPGTDHAGIATQAVVEKRLQQEGKRRSDFTRSEFVQMVQSWKDQYEATILEQLRAMGASCDFDRTRFTMDPVCTAAVRRAFHTLFNDGLIYRGKRLVNWDPATRTALADDEVEMEEIDGHMWYLRYPLADGSGTVTVATTRPETMLGDTAVAVNPRDPRAAALRGKKVRLPIVDREVPIIEDDFVVMPASMSEEGAAADPKAAFATGFLKVTPAHDPNDYDIGRRHQLPLINIFAPDATISDRHGWSDVSAEARAFLGKSREDARTAVVAWFKAKGLLEGVKPYRHAVGHSYRSHVPIEPYLSEQWYVRVTDDRMAGRALRAMDPSQFEGKAPPKREPGDGELRFFPARFARTYQQWHEGIRDWCISRQLWWGHRIPVWFRESTDPALTAIAEKAAGEMVAIESRWSKAGCPHRVRRRDDGVIEETICLPESPASLVAEAERDGFRQDEDVLDTWFSSALWPLATLGWPEPARFSMEGLLETFNPSTVLFTGREIITLWVSRMVMFNRYFRNATLPFRQVFIHPTIQDGFGQKMSKSLGNGVDPRDIIHSHGADAMRFVLTQTATDTQDVRMPVDMVDPATGDAFTPKFFVSPDGYQVAEPIQASPGNPNLRLVSGYGAASGSAKPTAEMPLARNTSARFDAGRNFATKIWNAARFALANVTAPAGESIDLAKASLIDRWMLAKLTRAVGVIDRALANYRFSEYADTLYDLFWRDFCDWYLEGIKPTIKASPAQQQVLRSVLDAILRLAHPILPFVTETLWPAVSAAGSAGVPGLELPPSTLLTNAAWPRPAAALEDRRAISEFSRLQTLIDLVRNLRGERQVAPRKQIGLAAPESLLPFLGGNLSTITATAGVSEIIPVSKAPAGSIPLTFEGAELLVLGLVDAVDSATEKSRLEKVIADRTRAISGYEGKLSNQGYLAKAKPEVVDETRRMLAQAQGDLAAARQALAALAG